MNDTTRNTSGGSGSFVLGALVGAGIALLLTPRTGKETRRRLADAGERLGDAARETFGRAREFTNDLKSDLKPAVKSAVE